MQLSANYEEKNEKCRILPFFNHADNNIFIVKYHHKYKLSANNNTVIAQSKIDVQIKAKRPMSREGREIKRQKSPCRPLKSDKSRLLSFSYGFFPLIQRERETRGSTTNSKAFQRLRVRLFGSYRCIARLLLLSPPLRVAPSSSITAANGFFLHRCKLSLPATKHNLQGSE